MTQTAIMPTDDIHNVVRIGVNVLPPVILQCVQVLRNNSSRIPSGCKRPGVWMELTDFIVRAAGLQPVFIKVPSEKFFYGTKISSVDGDKFTGVQLLLQNNEIDVSPLNYYITEARVNDGFQFAFPLKQETSMFLVPAGREPSTFFSKTLMLTKTFQPETWVAISIFLTMLYLFVHVRQFLQRYHKKATKKTLLCNKWAYHRVASSVLAYSLLFFSSLYQGLLLTSLMLSPPDNYPSTYDQVVDAISNRHVQLVFPRTGGATELMIQFQEEHQPLKHALAGNPAIYEANLEKGMQMVESGRYMYVASDLTARYSLSWTCNVQQVRITDGYPATFMFSPSFQHMDRINEAILDNYEVVDKLLERYAKYLEPENHEEKCLRKFGPKPTTESTYKVIELTDLTGCFGLWVLGLILSLIAFFVSLKLKYKHKTAMTSTVFTIFGVVSGRQVFISNGSQ